MTDLLSRLSSEGPSRELDAEIALANGWKQVSDPKLIAPYWRSPTGQICPQPPRYTESIDAALTLLGENVMRVTLDFVLGTAAVTVANGKTYAGEAESTNNALLIAIEKAKEDSKP